MTGDFTINGQDAYTTFGITAGDGFIDALLIAPPKKGYLSNNSRLNNGEDVDNRNSKFDKKTNITLYFDIEGFGSNEADMKASYLAHLKLFYQELAKDEFNINVPALGTEVYHLIYSKPSTFNSNLNKTHSKMSFVFDEPNPTNRT